jgi:ubiquinone/menaquinone biosynthesis C-methylase UbiE
LEPYILPFAKFDEACGKDVLEIGVGMGADHAEWAKSQPRSLTGIDLTPRAIEHTRQRLAIYGFKSDLRVGDAESLPFRDESFDVVYSWGVLHHSPNTSQAVQEVFRVLRPNGVARVMIYHKYSVTGFMLWARYALLIGRPFRSLSDIFAKYMERPGTKAYTVQGARTLFEQFRHISVQTQLSFADLLQGEVGQRHRGVLLSSARTVWPRPLVRRIFKNQGLCLLIEAQK